MAGLPFKEVSLSMLSSITLSLLNTKDFCLDSFSYHEAIKGVSHELCPASCLSNLALVRIISSVSPASWNSLIGNSTQFSCDGKAFLKTSKVCGLPWLSTP